MDKKRINKTNIFKIVAAILGIVILVGVAMRESNRNKVEAPDVEPEVTTATTTPVTTLVSTTTENTTTENTSETTTEITTEETTTTEIVTDAPVIEVVPETETPKAEEVVDTEPIAEVQPVETEKQEEYLVYKESTHYIHKSICRWNKGDAYRVDDVTGLEARLCSECNPVCEGYTEYIPPEPVKQTPTISDYDYTLLCKIVASEYGGMSDVYERAKIVASVMNQVKYTGNSIETCLYNSCVPWGFCPWNDWFGGTYYTDMSDAVDYYFNNLDVFAYWDCDSWWGDGYYNHFYKA